MKIYHFHQEMIIAIPLDQVFAFFSKAENLERVTPDFLRFKILSPLPIEMKTGLHIDYQIRLAGLPFKWKTEISLWEPPHRFIDSQLKGPYKQWIHEHRFESMGDSTKMSDHVKYALHGGPLAPVIHQVFVRKKIESIFAHRKIIMDDIFK